MASMRTSTAVKLKQWLESARALQTRDCRHPSAHRACRVPSASARPAAHVQAYELAAIFRVLRERIRQIRQRAVQRLRGSACIVVGGTRRLLIGCNAGQQPVQMSGTIRSAEKSRPLRFSWFVLRALPREGSPEPTTTCCVVPADPRVLRRESPSLACNPEAIPSAMTATKYLLIAHPRSRSPGRDVRPCRNKPGAMPRNFNDLEAARAEDLAALVRASFEPLAEGMHIRAACKRFPRNEDAVPN